MTELESPTALFDGWRAGLGTDVICITRCAECRNVQWYPTARCPRCRSQQWEWFDAGRRGRLFSWTRVFRPTVVLPDLDPPYVYGVVSLLEADQARVIALASDHSIDPTIGAEVVLDVIVVRGTPMPRFAVPRAN